MSSRFAREVEALEALLTVAEQRFHLWQGALRSDEKYHPLVNYRMLVCLVAADAGYDYNRIASVLYRDPTSVRYARNKAAQHVVSEQRWWLENKAVLIDLWEDALG